MGPKSMWRHTLSGPEPIKRWCSPHAGAWDAPTTRPPPSLSIPIPIPHLRSNHTPPSSVLRTLVDPQQLSQGSLPSSLFSSTIPNRFKALRFCSLNMVTEPPSSIADSSIAEQPLGGSIPNKKTTEKVPKKEHKAKREKLKRDHLNELFSELGHVLEPARQNNGKASILGDATRLLRDLIAQVESLRKENAALVTESRYVDVEKNELKDENTVLGAEIERLQNELHERTHSNPVWHDGAEVAPPAPPQPTTAAPPMHRPPVGPLYVIPIHQELHPFPEAGDAPAPPKTTSHVRRPHARYPTPSDSWPLELLSRHQRAAHEAQHKGSSSSMTSNTREEGADGV